MTDTEQPIKNALEEGAKILPDSIITLDNIFCGCGDPESAWAWVLNYLESRSKEDNEYREEDQGGSGLIVAYLLDHIGLTVHGGSVGGAWLTESGVQVLAFLKENGPDWQEEGKWIDRDGVWRSNLD